MQFESARLYCACEALINNAAGSTQLADPGTASQRERIIILSDLHLGVERRAGLFSADRPLREFLIRVSADAERDRAALRVAFLGDTFDFPSVGTNEGYIRGSDADLVDRCERILAVHSEFRDGLRLLLKARASIDFLPGNHDPALMRPAIQRRLEQEFVTAGADTLRFHPWVLHIPGVLFAEHGNQYHDINSFPAWLNAQKTELSQWPVPIGAQLDEFKRTEDAGGSVPGVRLLRARHPLGRLFGVSRIVATALFQVVVQLSPISRRTRSHYRDATFGQVEYRSHIPANVLVAIDIKAEAIARSWPTRLGSTVINKVSLGKVGRSGFPMGDAEKRAHFSHIAQEISEILLAAGRPTPWVVFGHTHLVDNHATLHANLVNTGTWISPEIGTDLLPFLQIEIDHATAATSGSLLGWHEGRSEIRSLEIRHSP
jgi:UDP-2,3-diacylglucosamine pyrophosphatase LpxH